MIGKHANSSCLRELYLDGCERINDEAILRLTKPRGTVVRMPVFGQFSDLCQATWLSQNGCRGLRTISLAECRSITDKGVHYIAKLQYLQTVCLLGCANVKDEGVIALAKELQNLDKIDLGSTSITNNSLAQLKQLCLNLRFVNILGCKRLNASDELILLRSGINVESGEDVFRFHLIPEYYSGLPRITNSVLKTRSTLSIHKVFKYLIKKLNEIDGKEILDLMITCKGLQLDPSLQLRTAKQMHWPDDESLLTLVYKRRPTL